MKSYLTVLAFVTGTAGFVGLVIAYVTGVHSPLDGWTVVGSSFLLMLAFGGMRDETAARASAVLPADLARPPNIAAAAFWAFALFSGMGMAVIWRGASPRYGLFLAVAGLGVAFVCALLNGLERRMIARVASRSEGGGA